MFCKECGKQIEDASTFCNKCGAEQTKTETSEAPQPEPQAAPADTPPNLTPPAPTAQEPEHDIWEGGRSERRFLHWYAVGIILLIGAVYAVWNFPEDGLEDVPMMGAWLSKSEAWIKYMPLIISVIILLIIKVRAFIYSHQLRYRLSSERLFITRGLISRMIDEMELIRINDVILSQSFKERLLGIGTVTVLSNDDTTPELVLPGIPKAPAVKEHIRSAARSRRKGGVFVEQI